MSESDQSGSIHGDVRTRVLSLTEAAEYITRVRGKRMPRSTLSGMALRKAVKGQRLSSGWVFRPADLDALLASMTPTEEVRGRRGLDPEINRPFAQAMEAARRRVRMTLEEWAAALSRAGVPASVSQAWRWENGTVTVPAAVADAAARVAGCSVQALLDAGQPREAAG
jgi:hypothetical protein